MDEWDDLGVCGDDGCATECDGNDGNDDDGNGE
jgi:hypothetical protein